MLCGGTQSGQVQGCRAAGRGDVCRRGSAPMTASLGTRWHLRGSNSDELRRTFRAGPDPAEDPHRWGGAGDSQVRRLSGRRSLATGSATKLGAGPRGQGPRVKAQTTDVPREGVGGSRSLSLLPRSDFAVRNQLPPAQPPQGRVPRASRLLTGPGLRAGGSGTLSEGRPGGASVPGAQPATQPGLLTPAPPVREGCSLLIGLFPFNKDQKSFQRQNDRLVNFISQPQKDTFSSL